MEIESSAAREVVRGEYFSCLGEPAITFKAPAVRFSAGCLRALPGVDYVLFIVCRAEKRLVIEPCSGDIRDAVRWSGLNPAHRKPKAIACGEFCRRMLALMDWREDCRYRLLGKIVEDGGGGRMIAFDLGAALTYAPSSRRPEYPPAWAGAFGMTKESHRDHPLLKRFTENEDEQQL